MGFVKHLLFWPVTGPVAGIRWSLGKVVRVAEEQLADDSEVKRELMELQMKLELGDITDDEYIEQEARLMVRLREVREWREKLGMGMAGGPVQVARPAEPDAQGSEEEDEGPESPPGIEISFG